jgi:predicted permease
MHEMGRAFSIFLVLFAGMILCIIIGYSVAFFLRLSRGSVGTFVQGAFRGNLAYVGLPLVLFVLQEMGEGTSAIAFLVIAPLIPLYNAGAVFVLVTSREGKDESFKRQIKSILIRTTTNPLFLSVTAGLLWSLTGWSIPLCAARTLEGIGKMSLPLALLGVGASLNFESLRGRIGHCVASAVIKVGIAPLLGYLIGMLIGLAQTELRIVMIYLACPTALASFVMAEQMEGDHLLASGIIVMTILLAIPALSIILLIT